MLSIATASSAGSHHRVNEDSASRLDGIAPLYVVADGVGGGAMAAWASRHLVSSMHRRLERGKRDAASLSRALLDADREIAKGIAHRSGASGAATVVACAATDAMRATWLVAWVGDCRAYVLSRSGAARLVTRDDTYGNLGEVPPPGGSPDDPARMIGNGAVSTPNVTRIRLGWDEMLVLASDGVHKSVDAAAIARYLRDIAPLARRCKRIVEAARSNGSEDDATVLVVHRRLEPRARLVRHGIALAAMLLAAAITFGVHALALACGRRTTRDNGGYAMSPEQIDRVFGRGRLKMVTGDHVEVFREAASDGNRRRYTKRFLDTRDGDFGQWTEREWRILARLIGHGIDCVPEVVQFDRGAQGGTQLVQTYDAGATVDQWATILPVEREGRVLRHVFEDCAHWWALGHHCLRALSAIHELSVVHLDIKGDNVCIPVWPPTFDPKARDGRLQPRFEALALIDFAFSLISRERLSTALPIGWQTEYDYQSPRLLQALEAGRRGDLQPTRELDWRCDAYSLAAMLRRYMPSEDRFYEAATGWTAERAGAAKDLILALRDAHDRDGSQPRPYPALMALTSARLAEPDMAASLAAGWRLARDAIVTPVAASPVTPLTRLAPSLRVMLSPRAPVVTSAQRVFMEATRPAVLRRRFAAPQSQSQPQQRSKRHRAIVGATLTVLLTAGVAAMVAPTLLSRVDWPGEDAPAAPVAREEDTANADAPLPREPEAASPPVAQAAPAPAPPSAAPATPSNARAPSRLASSPTPAVANAKSAPRAGAAVKVAVQQPPVRIRFHQEPPLASPAPAARATRAPEASPTPVVAAAPAAPVVAAAPAPAEPPPRPAPAPAQTPPAPARSTAVAEVRGLLTMLFDLGRHDRSRAPIEDRVIASASPRAQPAPVEVVPTPKPEPALAFVPAVPAPAMVREPAPRATPPVTDPDLAVEARRMLAESIPYSAARAQGELSRVMWIAANASRPGQERAVVDAVRQSWSNHQVVTSAASISPDGRPPAGGGRTPCVSRRPRRQAGVRPAAACLRGESARSGARRQPGLPVAALATGASGIGAPARRARHRAGSVTANGPFRRLDDARGRQRPDGPRDRCDQRVLRGGRSFAQSGCELQGGTRGDRLARRARSRARGGDDGAHP